PARAPAGGTRPLRHGGQPGAGTGEQAGDLGVVAERGGPAGHRRGGTPSPLPGYGPAGGGRRGVAEGHLLERGGHPATGGRPAVPGHDHHVLRGGRTGRRAGLAPLQPALDRSSSGSAPDRDRPGGDALGLARTVLGLAGPDHRREPGGGGQARPDRVEARPGHHRRGPGLRLGREPAYAAASRGALHRRRADAIRQGRRGAGFVAARAVPESAAESGAQGDRGGHRGGTQRYILVRNPEQAERDRAQREQILARLREELAGLERRPKEEHTRAVCALIAHPTYGRYLKLDSRRWPVIDRAKVEAEARLDGKYLLRTSDDTLCAGSPCCWSGRPRCASRNAWGTAIAGIASGPNSTGCTSAISGARPGSST